LQETKIKVNLSGVELSSLAVLYGRAKTSKESSSLFNDAKSVELIERIDFDFSLFEKASADYTLFTNVARTMQFDERIKAYITRHPQASIVNLGAGLDTDFYRIDNNRIHWYDLDLPEVIEVKKQLLPETDRMTYIAKSFLDPSWYKEINSENGVFIIAGGLLRYFDETQVRQFFLSSVNFFPCCEIVFEAESKSSSYTSGGGYYAGWSDSEPDKQSAMQAENLRSFKNAWMIISPTFKNKVFCALTTSTKPQSIEWDDFEVWWNQLSAQEKDEVARAFVASLGTASRWTMDDANEMMKWDNRIELVEQFPLFKNIPRDHSLSMSIRQFMDYTDEKGRMKIVHLRV
jgi:O-methyltransferase involved in polyketide biosynthesis